MVSRKLLDELVKARAACPRPPVSRPPGTIPIEEAQTRTGLSRMELLKLRESGLITRRSSDYQFHVDETSIQSLGRLTPEVDVQPTLSTESASTAKRRN